MSPHVLLVDDEPDILTPLTFALERQGFTVETAMNGDTALESARRTAFDVVVLDVMLPGISGLDVCRTLRDESDVPILMLTARDAEIDRILGLELGADDYVAKPFSTRELVSRLRAILRRRQLDRNDAAPAEVIVGGITIDFGRHAVTVDGMPIGLTPSEFKLLILLAETPGSVFSRSQIMEHLWQTPFIGDTRACDAHISNLRKKIERDPTHPTRILTVREVGYKLVAV